MLWIGARIRTFQSQFAVSLIPMRAINKVEVLSALVKQFFRGNVTCFHPLRPFHVDLSSLNRYNLH